MDIIEEKKLELYLDNQVLSFYGWWEFVVCLFAFVALMSIWYHIGRKKKDYGQVFLALSVLCWSFSGIVEILYSNHFLSSLDTIVFNETLGIEKQKLNGWRSIFSLFNSLFILLSLPWFRYIPKRVDNIVSSKYWPYIIGLPFVFSIIPTIRHTFSGKANVFVSELDVYYAILTLGFLAIVLWTSFYRRRLRMLSWLSLLCIIVILTAQLFKFTDSEIYLSLSSAIFKSSLIMLFFALALSWVKELSENIIPDSKQLYLSLKRLKTDTGKFQHFCIMNGIPGKNNLEIKLTPNAYQLLEKFIIQRKLGVGWLEMKPKAEIRSSKEYDIKDYNEIKRLLHNLLDGLFGKRNWTKSHHEIPLKTTLFENNNTESRKIRLKLEPDHLTI